LSSTWSNTCRLASRANGTKWFSFHSALGQPCGATLIEKPAFAVLKVSSLNWLVFAVPPTP
jgi:hypothetical protein